MVDSLSSTVRSALGWIAGFIFGITIVSPDFRVMLVGATISCVYCVSQMILD